MMKKIKYFIKITENQRKIAETIYTPFKMVIFLPVLTFKKQFSEENS
jgi:hypothetical protein